MKIGTFLVVVVLIVVGAALVALKLFVWQDLPDFIVKPLACTQEAKVCPDGSSVGRSGPNCDFAQCPAGPAFGDSIMFAPGKKIVLADGMNVALENINDSRCKPNVVCVWAGELSPLFSVSGGSVGDTAKQIQLGTSTAKQVATNGYVFTLNDATDTSATITITKQVAADNCHIGGCSSEICSDKADMVSSCIYKSEYSCYKMATCAKQKDGQCGWTQTPELTACLNNSK